MKKQYAFILFALILFQVKLFSQNTDSLYRSNAKLLGNFIRFIKAAEKDSLEIICIDVPEMYLDTTLLGGTGNERVIIFKAPTKEDPF